MRIIQFSNGYIRHLAAVQIEEGDAGLTGSLIDPERSLEDFIELMGRLPSRRVKVENAQVASGKAVEFGEDTVVLKQPLERSVLKIIKDERERL